MTLHPDEQARELAKLADEWLYEQAKSMRFSSDFTPQQVPSLVALLARVRLAEAEWWREQSHEGAICSPQDCQQCTRIAGLRQAAGERT